MLRGSRGGSRSRTVKHRGSRRLTPGDERARSEEQGSFGNDLVQVQVRLALDSLKDHGGGYEKTGQGFGQPRWTQVRRGSISGEESR
ncbi:hypothetical protein LB506_004394 [Fusarium annulatum]|nr:hypothetical protein LB506_004394 [Fusarium annulatum]